MGKLCERETCVLSFDVISANITFASLLVFPLHVIWRSPCHHLVGFLFFLTEPYKVLTALQTKKGKSLLDVLLILVFFFSLLSVVFLCPGRKETESGSSAHCPGQPVSLNTSQIPLSDISCYLAMRS